MKSLRMVLMAVASLILFSGQALAEGEFDSIVKSFNMIENKLGQTKDMVFDVGASCLGDIGSVVNPQSVKALLTPTVFNGSSTSMLRSTAVAAAGIVDGIRTGISGWNSIAADVMKSDLVSKIFPPSPVDTMVKVNQQQLSVKQQAVSASFPKISSNKPIEGLGKFAQKNLEGLNKPLSF
jgi:hypothetical protein